MSSISSSTSVLGRFKPIIVIATGLVAAYGSYVVYTSWHPSASTPGRGSRLRRTNAVRRRRSATSRPDRLSVYFVSDLDDDSTRAGLWPDCCCSVNDLLYTFSLDSPLPTVDEFRNFLGLDGEPLNNFIFDVQVEIAHVVLRILDDSDDTSIVADDQLRELQSRLRSRLRETSLDEDIPTGAIESRWALQAAPVAMGLHNYLHGSSGDGIRPTRRDELQALNDDTEAGDDSGEDVRDSDVNLKAMLYHIAEEEARRQAYIHRGTRCDSCGMLPIKGIRWHCLNCPDFDLCSVCEAQGEHHRSHVFAKIQIPICTLTQPREISRVWYPGAIRRTTRALQSDLRKHLALISGFDDTQIDAYREQFLCLSIDSPRGEYVIDRETFYKALVTEDSRSPLAPNYVYDRMFAFYDTDGDQHIDFSEFVLGLSFILHPAKRTSMRRIFDGYDQDEDGLISRADMMRMFRAKYVIHKTMILDVVNIQNQQAHFQRRDENAMQSNQPISSLFTEAEVPGAESRAAFNKPLDRFCDPQTLNDPLFSQPILPDGETDIDSSFWHAVFERYGSPEKLTQLHPQFNARLDARRHVRGIYTRTEALPLDEQGKEYLVNVDERGIRGPSAQGKVLESEWRQDIKDLGRITDGTTETAGVGEDAHLYRDRAIKVTRSERDVGEEVLFQVTMEGLNEIIDPLFKSAEQRAKQVIATRRARDRYRNAIEGYKRQVQKDKDAIATVEDQAQARTPDATTSSVRNDAMTIAHIIEQPNTDMTERERAARSMSPTPETSNHPPEPITSETARPETQESETNERPQMTQDELLGHVRASALPTDQASLQTMEDGIREQSLESLLESAGYSVEGPSSESAEQELSSQPTSVPVGTSLQDNDVPHIAGTAPDTEQENMHSSTAALRGGDVDGSPSSLSSSSSTPSVTADPDAQSGSPSISSQSRRASHPHARRGGRRERSSNGSEVPELDWNDSTVERLTEEEGDMPCRTEAPESSTETAGAADAVKSPSHDEGKDASPRVTSAADAKELPPTQAQLAEWAELDAYEETMKERKGPARITLAEFEEAIQKDEEAGTGHLKGLVESWLEWAGF